MLLVDRLMRAWLMRGRECRRVRPLVQVVSCGCPASSTRTSIRDSARFTPHTWPDTPRHRRFTHCRLLVPASSHHLEPVAHSPCSPPQAAPSASSPRRFIRSFLLIPVSHSNCLPSSLPHSDSNWIASTPGTPYALIVHVCSHIIKVKMPSRNLVLPNPSPRTQQPASISRLF